MQLSLVSKPQPQQRWLKPMSFTSIIAGILALAKAVPIIDSWIQQLSTAYLQQQISTMKQANIDAIRLALVAHDQRGLENAIGSPTAGLPSGDAGSTIISGLPPGVSNTPANPS